MGSQSMFNLTQIQSKDKNCGFENQNEPKNYQNIDPSEEFTFASSDTSNQPLAGVAPTDCLSVTTDNSRIKLRRVKKLEAKVTSAEE